MVSVSSLQHSPGKIFGDWVNRLERINANIDDEGRLVGASSQETKQLSGSSQTNGELCFKTAQLLTELLLMLFAAGLLVIVAIVVVSRRIPSFMESYEVVPEFLFFACVIIASYSLLRWLAVKIRRRSRGTTKRAAGAKEPVQQNGAGSGEQGQQQQQGQQQTEPLLMAYETEARLQKQRVQTKTCPPPIRQVASASFGLLSELEELAEGDDESAPGRLVGDSGAR